MEIETAPHRVPQSWRTWLGVAGMVLVGGVAGLLAAIISLLAFAEHGSTTGVALGIVGVFTVLTLGPAVALRWTHHRNGYACAVGLAGCWAALTIWALPGMLAGPGMSSEQIDRATQRINASDTPAYSVGDTANGRRLDEVYRDGEFGATGVSVGYGLVCEGGDLGCSSDIYVRTFSMSPQYVDVYGCERLPPVLGVPTVKRATDQSLILFTGSSVVSLEDFGSTLESELALARTLRPLGGSEPLTTLPAPTRAILRYVDRACG